jgi:hypothetical protein
VTERHEIRTRRPLGSDRRTQNTPDGSEEYIPGILAQPCRTPYGDDRGGPGAPERPGPYGGAVPGAGSYGSPYGVAQPSGATPPPSPYGGVPLGGAGAAPSPYASLAASAPPSTVGSARSPYTDELDLGIVATRTEGRSPERAGRRGEGSRRAGSSRQGGRPGRGGRSEKVLELDVSRSSRTAVREQRAGRRRTQRVRRGMALGASVVAVGVVATITGLLPLGDLLRLKEDEAALTSATESPSPTESSPTEQSPSPTETPTQTPSGSATSSPTASPTSTSSPTGTPSSTTQPSTTKKSPTSTSSTSRRPSSVGGSQAGGWYAGASGVGVTDGKFQDWVGQPVSVASTWADTSDEVQRTLSGVSEFKGWKGALDVAVGGTVLGSGENYAAAARGEYDDRWRSAAKVLADTRKGATGPTFIRPFHEMNGDWYENWMVTKSNSADYKKAFARMAKIYRSAMPGVYVVFSPNYDDHTGLPVSYWYPGDDVVDVIGVDYYDDGSSEARFSAAAWNSESFDKDGKGNPTGPEAWRQFAAQHGKPISFPEWGLKPEGDGQDHPEWIKSFNSWMNKHANGATWRVGQDIPRAAAGKVLYSVYFNVVHGGNEGFTIHGKGANPKSEAVYPKLKWGNRRS